MNTKKAEDILCDYIDINSAFKLAGVIADLKDLVSRGLLKQVSGNSNIETIPDAPPYEQDIITIELETIPNGTRYTLICDACHGSGGSFKRNGYVDEEATAAFEKRVISKDSRDLLSSNIPRERFFHSPSQIDLEIMDFFIQKMQELYEVKFSLARHLYKVWNIKILPDKQSVESFLTSSDFVKAIIPNGTINILKRYTQKELLSLHARLEVTIPESHDFTDTRFGYRWRQVYHGMGECWLDLYEVNEPELEESLNQTAKKLIEDEK